MQLIKFGSSILAIIALISLISMVLAVEPSQPSSMTYMGNETKTYTIGSEQNLTRGYIHTINLLGTQPSMKWIGVVGNVSGEYALVDGTGYNLYDWDISSITGEVYASRESSSGGWRGISGGGMPNWANLTCANSTLIDMEAYLINHSGSHASEDSLQNTFLADPFELDTFYAGDRKVSDTTVFGSDPNCYGINLNQNDADGSGSTWQEAILTDQTKEVESGHPDYGDTDYEEQYDLLYVGLIDNDADSYHNGTTYDFQMILPQMGTQGTYSNIPYYFYVELI